MQENNKDSNKDDNRPVLTLGVTSQLSGIPAHSIRQYVEKGLIIPFKLDSKRHLFSMNDVNRLKNIQYLIHEQGLNFSGIRALLALVPCWNLIKCSKVDQQNCEAYKANSAPCWEASEKGQTCKNKSCRECNVYLWLSNSTDLKAFLQELS